MQTRFTVFFEDTFWIGIIEVFDNGNYSYCKIIFGKEPSCYEIHDYLTKNYLRLNFHNSDSVYQSPIKKVSPKRLKRIASKELVSNGISTFSQDAIRIEQEKLKKEKQKDLRKKTQEQKRELFILKQEIKKEKHKGH